MVVWLLNPQEHQRSHGHGSSTRSSRAVVRPGSGRSSIQRCEFRTAAGQHRGDRTADGQQDVQSDPGCGPVLHPGLRVGRAVAERKVGRPRRPRRCRRCQQGCLRSHVYAPSINRCWFDLTTAATGAEFLGGVRSPNRSCTKSPQIGTRKSTAVVYSGRMFASARELLRHPADQAACGNSARGYQRCSDHCSARDHHRLLRLNRTQSAR